MTGEPHGGDDAFRKARELMKSAREQMEDMRHALERALEGEEWDQATGEEAPRKEDESPAERAPPRSAGEAKRQEEDRKRFVENWPDRPWKGRKPWRGR